MEYTLTTNRAASHKSYSEEDMVVRSVIPEAVAPSMYKTTNLTESDSCDSLPYWERRPDPPPLPSLTPSESVLFLPVRQLGKVQPYQILGTPEQLFAEAARRGLQEFPGLSPPELALPPQQLLQNVAVDELWQPGTEDVTPEGDRPLRHWGRLLAARRRQELRLAERTQRPPQALCMHSAGDFRQRWRSYIHSSVPDGPPAPRPDGIAFWKIESRFGGEFHGLIETLPDWARGQRARASLDLHVPELIRRERGTDSGPEGKTGATAGYYHRDCRPQTPDDDPDLIVVGCAVPPQREPKPPENEMPKVSITTPTESDFCEEGDHGIPALLLAGQKAAYRPGPPSARTKPIVHATLSLSAPAGRLCRRYVPLASAGDVAIHYSWRAVPHSIHFGRRAQAPVLFFDSGSGVLLPGRVLELPVILSAATAGLYSQSWDLITQPRLEGGAPIRLQIYALAGMQDPYGPERQLLQDKLEKKVAIEAARAIMDILVRRATLREEVPPAPQPINSLEVRFSSSNPGLKYRSAVVQQLIALHQDVQKVLEPPVEKHSGKRRQRKTEETVREPWDLNCARLKSMILLLSYGEQQSELLARLYKLVEPLWRPPVWPAPGSAAAVVRAGLLVAIQRFSDCAFELEVRLGVQRAMTGAAEAPNTGPTHSRHSVTGRRARNTSTGRERRRRTLKRAGGGSDSRGRSHGTVAPTTTDSMVSMTESISTAGNLVETTGAGATVPPAVQARLKRGLYAVMRALLSDFLEDITEPLEAVARPLDEFLITEAMCGSQKH